MTTIESETPRMLWVHFRCNSLYRKNISPKRCRPFTTMLVPVWNPAELSPSTRTLDTLFNTIYILRYNLSNSTALTKKTYVSFCGEVKFLVLELYPFPTFVMITTLNIKVSLFHIVLCDVNPTVKATFCFEFEWRRKFYKK